MDVLLIQPSIVYPDQGIAGRHQSVRQKEGYIEIGLLSVASFLHSKNLDVKILDLSNNQNTTDQLRLIIEKNRPRLVAISCISGYSYPTLQEYSKLIKTIDPSIYILTGGQHSGPLGEIVLNETPTIDCVIRYEGEILTWKVFEAVILNKYEVSEIPGIIYRNNEILSTEDSSIQLDINNLPFLNYNLFPNHSKYVPRIEESRGCPYDCSFCSNAAVFTRNVRYKTADRLIEELLYIHEQFGRPATFRFYLISKNYGLNEEVTLDFAAKVKELPFDVEWRTQSTVDVFNPDILAQLSEAGLRMIDLGLESASVQMLLNMNKTNKRPTQYLEKAVDIITKAADIPNTKVKFNLLLHPGETATTLAETLEFLFRWRQYIDAVTASPVMIDPGAPIWHNMEYYEQNFGTRLLRNDFWDSIHIYPADPSSDLTFEQANTMSTIISKMFQSKEAYYATRQFGGLQPNVKLNDFDHFMQDVPDHLKPYSEDK